MVEPRDMGHMGKEAFHVSPGISKQGSIRKCEANFKKSLTVLEYHKKRNVEEGHEMLLA